MHPRYFIAITLPDDISHKISEIQRQLYLPGKIMQPLVPHITLLDPNILQSISPLYLVPKLKEAAKKLMPVEILLSGTGIFHKQILHITVDSSELLQLQSELISLLPQKVRAQHSIGRSFVPHVTLAQAKPKQNIDPNVLQKFVIEINEHLPYKFQADHLTQFTWKSPQYYELYQI